jgi:hypothetical protein
VCRIGSRCTALTGRHKRVVNAEMPAPSRRASDWAVVCPRIRHAAPPKYLAQIGKSADAASTAAAHARRVPEAGSCNGLSVDTRRGPNDDPDHDVRSRIRLRRHRCRSADLAPRRSESRRSHLWVGRGPAGRGDAGADPAVAKHWADRGASEGIGTTCPSLSGASVDTFPADSDPPTEIRQQYQIRG